MLNEADTRVKLIDPALHERGWSEGMISREVTAPAIEIVRGRARRQGKGRADYVLQAQFAAQTQPIKVAIIEAKEEAKHPGFGLDQGKAYADTRRLNVPFVFSSNGHLFVEFDALTGLTSEPRLLAEFPQPHELLERWQRVRSVDLAKPVSRPLLTPYVEHGFRPRYYQDAAIRATLEHVATGKKRALLSLSTASGKTFIAAHILRRIADAGELRRALFVCDRDELRTQGIDAMQAIFGGEVAEVSRKDLALNARVAVATYQTLGLPSDDDATISFLLSSYPPNYFSHIVLDECHRSAWGTWRQVLSHNSDAVQIGLTATPRRLVVTDDAETVEDDAITADNVGYFGEPVYEYTMAQGMEDGFLAACEIVRRDILLERDGRFQREEQLTREDLRKKKLRDARTGVALTPESARKRYVAPSFDDDLLLPERVEQMAADLFDQLLRTGGPEQKTIIFCTRDRHANDVAVALNNLYVRWCKANSRTPVADYAFRCTADNNGASLVADFRTSARHHWIATTVDLLTTGVDVPGVVNVVFFRYVRSPMAFTQMLGRGMRLDPKTDKLMFRVFDYTNATRLLGRDFLTRLAKLDETAEPPSAEPERVIEVRGFAVQVSDAGRAVIRNVDGKPVAVSLEAYEAEIAAKVRADVGSLDELRTDWIDPSRRMALVQSLPEGEEGLRLVQDLNGLDDCDLYDVLAQVAFDARPLTKPHRAFIFSERNSDWLAGLPTISGEAVRAIVGQFGRAGIEGLERKEMFETPDLVRAGGIAALIAAGDPSAILRETKFRVLA